MRDVAREAEEQRFAIEARRLLAEPFSQRGLGVLFVEERLQLAARDYVAGVTVVAADGVAEGGEA